MKLREYEILIKKGFNIFRCPLFGPRKRFGKRIWQYAGVNSGVWMIYSRHETAAAAKKTWDALMRVENNLAG